MNAARQQRGVGLIEILIAVVVISIGFLAAARMQVDSMRNSQSAYFRSQAYFMASAMVDRMRANVEGVRGGFYDGVKTAADVVDAGCRSAVCTPKEIAQQDLYDWSASLHPPSSEASGFTPLLPSDDTVSARGEIIRTDEGRYTVKLVWAEVVEGATTRPELTVDFVAEL